MAYLTDEQLEQAVLDLFDGKHASGFQAIVDGASCGCCPIALQFHDHNIYTIPGGYTLLQSINNTRFVGLDWLFDISDEHMERFRTAIISALEKRDISFIPVSWNAFFRLPGRHEHSATVIHRVGRECVFSLDEKYYISGYDRNENPPLYFLARLPRAVSTYNEAIEALKPQSVKLAEERGAKVLRQGDMFAIPTNYVTLSLTRMGAVFFNPDDEGFSELERGLYGTAHYATDTARLPDGTMFGRGQLWHRPHMRRADHHDLDLIPDDGSWFLIVRNTVPIQLEGR